MSTKIMRRALYKLSGYKNKSNSSFSLTEFEDDYKVTERCIGSSQAQDSTYLAKSVTTGEDVSVKVISKEGLTKSELKRIINEVNVLRKLQHPNVVAVYDVYDREDGIYVVSEYIAGQTLADRVLDETTDFTESDCRFVLKSVVSALKYCKEKGVVHRNIIPENIIYSKTNGRNVLKLVDFRWSKQLRKHEMDFSLLETMCGTPTFVAPEVLRERRSYNYKCDVWSLGVVLFLLLSGGYFPFSTTRRDSLAALLNQIKKGQWGFTPANAWAGVSEEAKDLVTHMLVKQPGGRYTYEQILAHSFFVPKSQLPARSSFDERSTIVDHRSSMSSASSYLI